MANHLESDDYFQVLNVSRSATSEEIKKSYRKLAIQWHPDKNRSHPRAEEYFKNINEAYEILSDPKKRKDYERYGKEGAYSSNSNNTYASHDEGYRFRHAQDIFNAFFGGRDPFADFFGHEDDEYDQGSQRGGRTRHGFGNRWDPMQDMMSDMGMGMGMGMGFGSRGNRMDPFGMMGHGFSDQSFMSFGSNGFGSSMSQSVSSSSYIDANGNQVTQKITTMMDSSGQKKTITEEYHNGQLVNSSESSTTPQLGTSTNPIQIEDDYTSSRRTRNEHSSGRRVGGRQRGY